jgi:transcriptional regulator with PAS, ATPase and Fis domain
MQRVYELIIKAAALEKEVLIWGESGTGKELVARTIHQRSERQKRAFVPVNCGAVSEALFEREFFGHRKGAFTSAERDTSGYFGAAHRGTLFLDEIGELPLAMQVKLLRVIDSGEYTPLGESMPRTTDVRLIAATNRNLPEMVQKQTMREDFFYRIHVIVITVPPLRERREDIPLLIEHFLKLYSHGNTLPTLPGSILEALYNYDWPGNIRQLQNTLYRYLSFGDLDFITPRSSTAFESGGAKEIELPQQEPTLTAVVEQVEKRVILTTLEQHRWHKTHTAAALGIPRSTLRRKMRKYGLE